IKLRRQGIHYLLVNPYRARELDALLNSTISNITRNPELAILSKKLGSWNLYKLGPYNVKKISIPLSDCSVDPRYTNASYSLNSTELGIFLELKATDINSRITCRLNVPKLNLSDYDYLIIDTKGSDNARVLMRFFLDNGKSFDVSYWQDVYILMNKPFDLHPYAGRTLRGELYISLKSSDGTPTSISIQQISFIRVKD
ncbi:MAG: hypothetical protein ACPL07_04010, partial [Candidatus Bathyarchaeia archaeon]